MIVVLEIDDVMPRVTIHRRLMLIILAFVAEGPRRAPREALRLLLLRQSNHALVGGAPTSTATASALMGLLVRARRLLMHDCGEDDLSRRILRIWWLKLRRLRMSLLLRLTSLGLCMSLRLLAASAPRR